MAPMRYGALTALALSHSAVALHGRHHAASTKELDISFHALLKEEAHSEKIAAEEFDCADETILRLAIAESFMTESQESCVERKTQQAFEEGGSGERAMMPPDEGGSGSGGSGMTREEVDRRIRQRCLTAAGNGIALGPRLIRMTFHDAADFHNLMFPNGTNAPDDMGRVDSCLHTALLSVGLSQAEAEEHAADWDEEAEEDEEVIEGDPNHNRGLNNAVRWILHMAAESHASRPDIQVLGAIVAMEAWLDGPEMMPKYGRERGSCSRPVCSNENCWDALTPFFKAPVAEPVGEGMFCPMTNTIEPLRNLLGLSLDELVALQGAHSVGGVIVCSGLGNVAAGPYCPHKCGLPPGPFYETGNFDGTAFDDTPGKLDNRYYQLLMDESYEGVPSCDEIRSSFPQLSKTGFRHGGDMSVGSGGSGGQQDRTEQCQVGVAFEDESQCEVEHCVEECALSEECQEAENTDDDDVEAYIEGWESCNLCKRMCNGKYRRRLGRDTQRDTLRQCRDDCASSEDCVESADYNNGECRSACRDQRDACYAEAGAVGFNQGECMNPCRSVRGVCRDDCESLTGRARNQCRRACNDPFSECRGACVELRDAARICRDTVFAPCNEECAANNAERQSCNECRRGCASQANEAMLEIDNRTGLEPRPTSWCKRLSEVKECLDTSVTLPINGGWGDCPEDMRLSHPNMGQGRMTVVQNVERWTTFRGLHKRVMVLPSDWSYLGNPETKALFQRYGTDEAVWKETFVTAFTKVSEKGWDGQLTACQAVECTRSADQITCPVAHETGVGNGQNARATARMQERRASKGLGPFVRPSTLEFPISQCEPSLSEAPASCQLIGGYGLKAKLQCGDTLTYCLTEAASAARSMIDGEWELGGKEPTCPAGDMAVLQAERKPTRPTRRLRSIHRDNSFIQSRAGMDKTDGMLGDDFEQDDFEQDDTISVEDDFSQNEEL